ncbi:MAG: molybdenum cofactor biosynthesis protein MoaE [Lachnospiraceae bacterium]|nr:molybdenum cofactor biosynthesis protein MoaE [Lachnospiraceae bacterium]
MEIDDNKKPGMDEWMKEAKASKDASHIGMYLFHNGVVREDAKALVRNNDLQSRPVKEMNFLPDREKAELAVQETLSKPGIYYARVWLNEGKLQVGDDIMMVLVGGDIRPNVVEALQFLVGKIKEECVIEKEIF